MADTCIPTNDGSEPVDQMEQAREYARKEERRRCAEIVRGLKAGTINMSDPYHHWNDALDAAATAIEADDD